MCFVRKDKVALTTASVAFFEVATHPDGMTRLSCFRVLQSRSVLNNIADEHAEIRISSLSSTAFLGVHCDNSCQQDVRLCYTANPKQIEQALLWCETQQTPPPAANDSDLLMPLSYGR